MSLTHYQRACGITETDIARVTAAILTEDFEVKVSLDRWSDGLLSGAGLLEMMAAHKVRVRAQAVKQLEYDAKYFDERDEPLEQERA